MESIELNRMLIKTFPNLSDDYLDEIEWQEGDNTGSHVVYGDVFTPYVVKCIEGQKKEEINNIFDYLEFLLSKKDAYADEVVTFSVIESIEYLLFENKELIEMMGNRTKELLNNFLDIKERD